jgi:hypothetical protein
VRTRPQAPPAPCFRDCPPDAPCAQCQSADWAPYPRPLLTGPEWTIIRQFLADRCGGRCERCGVRFFPHGPAEFTVHHRRHKGMGGHDDSALNGLANLGALCWGCHLGDRGAELAPAQARADGWTVVHGLYVPGDRPPEVDVPVLLHTGRRAHLDPIIPTYRETPVAA